MRADMPITAPLPNRTARSKTAHRAPGGVLSDPQELVPEHLRVGEQRAVIVLANKPALRVGQQVPLAGASAVGRVDVPQSRAAGVTAPIRGRERAPPAPGANRH